MHRGNGQIRDVTGLWAFAGSGAGSLAAADQVPIGENWVNWLEIFLAVGGVLAVLALLARPLAARRLRRQRARNLERRFAGKLGGR
ncbi:MAG: hypothetical protein JWP04_383 [Belnapia sp.]|nr:hypothetical protein [Belnapia sp.]